MRLIRCETLALEEFVGGMRDDDIPPYAILSHTWGSEEVSFHEMNKSIPWFDAVNRRALQEKEGYKKIQGACTKTLEHSLRYLWVDTCCIDKTSSSELTEAINSMYRYYRKAKVCFAYLSDVPGDSEGAMMQTHKVMSSRWFTRGWTLQELLAPKNPEFYASDWTMIGTCSSMAETISAATGINQVFLKGQNIMTASVAQRMSWASERATTRPEDRAYCLLGLFGVQMPLLYGEGGDNAFLRLQEGIMKISSDQSVFAWGYMKDLEDLPSPKNEGLSRSGWSPPVRINFLARSPFEFRDSEAFIPYPHWEPSTTYELTNRGVRITLPLCHQEVPNIQRFSDQECLAAIGCHREDDLWHIVAIHLRHVSGDHYERIKPVHDAHMLLVPRNKWTNPDVRRIYINLAIPTPTNSLFESSTVRTVQLKLCRYSPRRLKFQDESYRLKRTQTLDLMHPARRLNNDVSFKQVDIVLPSDRIVQLRLNSEDALVWVPRLVHCAMAGDPVPEMNEWRPLGRHEEITTFKVDGGILDISLWEHYSSNSAGKLDVDYWTDDEVHDPLIHAFRLEKKYVIQKTGWSISTLPVGINDPKTPLQTDTTDVEDDDMAMELQSSDGDCHSTAVNDWGP